ncbi:hypothetical protein EBR78_02765 [bacterium]|nr:hypothetical protein [bacterium]
MTALATVSVEGATTESLEGAFVDEASVASSPGTAKSLSVRATVIAGAASSGAASAAASEAFDSAATSVLFASACSLAASVTASSELNPSN